MYAWLESHPIAHSDSDILSLSWKGSLPQSEKEKQYIRKRSCVTGWLAVGTRKCVVGVTFSSIHTLKEYNYPLRTNFNLRGHNAEVVLVRWNEPFQKMATCDANGVIFVWIRFESRWSIELVNDRQHQVTDFAWSHDGRMALIAYKDGFVLVGSVQGQRYWSSQLNLQPHGSSITCGAWTADDKTVLFGTNSGQIVAMDIHGAVLSQVGLSDRTKPIQYMCYNCEKFRMSFVTETIDGENRVSSSTAATTATTTAPAVTSGGAASSATNTTTTASASGTPAIVSTSGAGAPTTSSAAGSSAPITTATTTPGTSATSSSGSSRNTSNYSECSKRSRSSRNKNLMMAVQVGNREINFMRSYDDVVGNLTDTHMTDLKMEWSACGSLLAVGGWCCTDKSPKIKFYSLNGIVRFTLNVPSKRLISALTWAHNDKRLFIAAGAGVFVALVEKHLSSLQQLARNAIVESLHPSSEGDVLDSMGLSQHLNKFVSHALQPTITPCFPKGMDLMKFVSTPPPVQKDAHTGEEKPTRYFCTMIVYEDERGRQSAAEKYGGPFVLYREYLGGLVPLLRGDKISKVRPEFVVYNPQETNSPAVVEGGCSVAPGGCYLCHDVAGGYCCGAVQNTGFSRQKSGVSLMSSPDTKRCLSDIMCDGDGNGGDDSIGIAGVGPSGGGGAGASASRTPAGGGESERDDDFSPLSGAEADRDESGSSHRRRKKKKKTKGQFRTPVDKVSTRCRDTPFPDKLPEKEPLIEVLANLWGTKFRLHGIHPNLPTDVGYVSYKTSVLHLQPRQMTIAIPLLDGSAKNPKSTALGTVVFPGSGNSLVAPLSQHLAVTAPISTPQAPNTVPICPRGPPLNVGKGPARGFKPFPGATSGAHFGNQSSIEDNDRQSASVMHPTARPLGPLGLRQSLNDRPPQLNHPLNNASSLYALQYHFLARQQQMQRASANQSEAVLSPEYGSDEEIMEQRVIQAVTSVKSGKPLEVAAAVASVLTNRSDDPVVSPMQRCPKHPVVPLIPQNRHQENSSANSSMPQMHSQQNPHDMRMFSNVFNPNMQPANYPSFPSHLHVSGQQCTNLAHIQNRSMAAPQCFVSPGCHKPTLNKPNPNANSSVAFMQREETCCRPRPQFTVRPKSCFAGGGVHSRSCSNSASTSANNMFLSLPPVQPPPLAHKPPITGPNVASNICRSDDDSAESGTDLQCSSSNAENSRPSSSRQQSIQNACSNRPASCALPVESNTEQRSLGMDNGSGESKPSEAQSTSAINFANANTTDSHYAAVQSTSSSTNDNCFLSPHNLFTCFHHTPSDSNASSSLYQSIPYYRTKSCPPTNQNSIDNSTTPQSMSLQTSQAMSGHSISGASSSHQQPSNTPISCRQEAAVRSKLGLMSLAPPAAAFGGSPDRNHARTQSWSVGGSNPSSANQNRKHSPSSRGAGPHPSGSGSQYNLCNNKSANIGDTSDSECYLSGDEAAGGAVVIANPEIRRRQMRKFRKLPRKPENLPKRSEKEEFVMLNKSPIWNESTQVYQLDFGGRVTQESAKNFQIEHSKDQVLQFGRIDDNAYTLDFQTPFSALQAFGIALANVTQRLK